MAKDVIKECVWWPCYKQQIKCINVRFDMQETVGGFVEGGFVF